MSTVKTAISIDESLFKKVDKLSNELHISRSLIFSQAVKYIIEMKENLELIRKINQAFSDFPDSNERKLQKLSKSKYLKVIKGTW